MNTEGFDARKIDEARELIFDHIRRKRDKKIIYFHGWDGFGAAPVLRSIAQELWSIKAKRTPPELCFDRIIYIDCSAWESRRVMQRKIAQELELDLGTMAMFDKQDEEDDFNGVDHSSRDVIRSVSEAIAQTLVYKKLMMAFLNGSGVEVDLNKFGISPDYWDHVIVWTFKRQPLTIHDTDHLSGIIAKLRYTHLFLYSPWRVTSLTSLEFCVLLREEATHIVARHPSMRDMDITMVMKCCLYELFLQHSFHRATGHYWEAHAPSYWMCDGIIKGDGTRDITDTLHQETHWGIDASQFGRVFEILMEDPKAPFLLVEDDTPLSIKGRPYPWISVTSKNLIIHEDTDKSLLANVSSLFVVLGKPDDPQRFPNGFLKHCIKLGVLILCRCAFRFVSPPFLRCHKLRFLGLDHCTNDNTSDGESNTNWTCLQNLWVLDLRYTEWDGILSEEKIDNMTNLMELNIEGFMCWQLVTRLHGKLPCLRRLRIIKPTHKADTSIESNNSFVDKTELEVLDLSGNRDMENLSICSSMARSLQMLILDACDGLENVVVSDGLPSSLRSFSFDGYGPATHWASSFKLPRSEWAHSSYTNKNVISKISLQGCTQLENLFVHGLPNLEELDLSGSAIKVIDLAIAMVLPNNCGPSIFSDLTDIIIYYLLGDRFEEEVRGVPEHCPIDFGTMVVNVPGLKRLILLGCQHLRAINWGYIDSVRLKLLCVDTRPWRAHGPTRPCLVEHKSFSFQLHATLTDARLARSLCHLLEEYKYLRGYKNIHFNIHITSSSVYGGGSVQLETTREEPSSQQRHVEVIPYADTDTFFKIGDAPMLFFPPPPTQQLDCHIEISDGSCGLEDELEHLDTSLAQMMSQYVESLHVHDASTSSSMSAKGWRRLKWCRMERCPNLGSVFPAEAWGNDQLQSIWASHLLMARCIRFRSKGHHRYKFSFQSLQHLHLCSCPRLQFVLPVSVNSFPSLKTLHIIYCGDLTHVLVLDKYPEEIAVQDLPFPKLTTIHLHDLPKLQQICEVKMLAPVLETIKIRGCFGLRRLPAVMVRRPGMKKPIVEIEKDVWDSLEWDGMARGHHPDLFEPPVHSRYYRQSRLLRGTVLR